ncbi:DUF1127 domain-containing protein [Consotaella aegiceratis]|uniref:DUF1127 domain-containing protein n=1 Tax=Consotaella aegiceratis TaxID=3097961 RepID=UPI002F416A5F
MTDGWTRDRIANADGSARRAVLPGAARTRLHWIWAWLGRQRRLRRSRRALLDLSDHQLRDIGLTRAEARKEGRRSFHLD